MSVLALTEPTFKVKDYVSDFSSTKIIKKIVCNIFSGHRKWLGGC